MACSNTMSGAMLLPRGHALESMARDEVFRIAGEALRNAFYHAGARQIEVELSCVPRLHECCSHAQLVCEQTLWDSRFRPVLGSAASLSRPRRNEASITTAHRPAEARADHLPSAYEVRNFLTRPAVSPGFSSGKKWPPFTACPSARGAHCRHIPSGPPSWS